jgi:hypothetical protein
MEGVVGGSSMSSGKGALSPSSACARLAANARRNMLRARPPKTEEYGREQKRQANVSSSPD